MARVSVSTVSRVLNEREGISEEAKAAVLAAIAALNFVPDESAKRMGGIRPGGAPSRPRSNRLALVTASVEHSRADAFLSPVMAALEGASRERGIECAVVGWGWGVAGRLPAIVRAQAVDGAVALGLNREQALALGGAVPVVTVDCYYGGTDLDAVEPDYRDGALLAVRHLVRSGRRRILVLCASPEGEGFARRIYDGYAAAHAEAGLAVDGSLVRPIVLSAQGGYDAARQVLAAPPDRRPDAIFANDEAALGVLRAADDLGVGVPRDVAVFGCDGLRMGEFSKPRLSTIAVDFSGMARTALERLIQRRDGKKSMEPIHVVVPVRLVIRESSGGVGG